MCLPTSMFSNKNDYWLGFSQIVKNIDSNYFESLLLFIIKFSWLSCSLNISTSARLKGTAALDYNSNWYRGRDGSDIFSLHFNTALFHELYVQLYIVFAFTYVKVLSTSKLGFGEHLCFFFQILIHLRVRNATFLQTWNQGYSSIQLWNFSQ